MEKSQLTPVQVQISAAIESMKEKSLITEANLAKKVRFLAKIEGKNKAGIGIEDLEKALEYCASNNIAVFSLSLNSVNEFMMKKDAEYKSLDSEQRKRRLSSEKSKMIFTNSDLTEAKSSKKSKELKSAKKIRTKTEKINIYSDFENLDD